MVQNHTAKYLPNGLPALGGGRIEPGRVFDTVTTLDGVSYGYKAMDDHEAIKVA